MKSLNRIRDGFFALCLSAMSVLGEEVHSVVDLGHEFSFYSDGRFQNQYLPREKGIRNWGNIYQIETSNLNLMIFLGCERRLTYTAKDIDYINRFLQSGGGVLLASYSGNKGQDVLAQSFGASFGPAAKAPYQFTPAMKKIAPQANAVQGGRQSTLLLDKPEEWEILLTDAEDRPLLAQRKLGEGCIVLASRGLFGSNPNGRDNINAEWVSPLLFHAAKNKKVEGHKALPAGDWNATTTKTSVNGINFFYSDYLAHCFEDMVDISNKALPLIEKRMGVPLSPGMGGSIGLLATDGGGYSSGKFVGLAVFWENFPVVQHGMYEFLTHEFVHSWVLPHPEVWNEPIATYVGNLVMTDAGFQEEGNKRIAQNILRAHRIDPTMKLYDIGGNGEPALQAGQKNEMHWGKSYWVLEEMRKLDPQFIASYFKAKRAYVPARLSGRYDMNDTVAIISKALAKDMYPWFNAHGMPCTYDKVKPEIKARLETPSK